MQNGLRRTKMTRYEIFLFDADATLYDYDMAEANALKQMFRKCGFDYSEEIRNKYRKINTHVWECYENGEITKEELQSLRFIRLFADIGVQYDVIEFNKQYLFELGKGTFLIEGALEICEYIVSSGKKIYIITNGVLATQTSRIKHSPLRDYITDFFVSELVGYKKPDALYFEHVLLHIPPIDKNKILIIGDSLTADIKGGDNTGIDTCWFNEYQKENHTGIVPTYEIQKLSEIRMFV